MEPPPPTTTTTQKRQSRTSTTSKRKTKVKKADGPKNGDKCAPKADRKINTEVSGMAPRIAEADVTNSAESPDRASAVGEPDIVYMSAEPDLEGPTREILLIAGAKVNDLRSANRKVPTSEDVPLPPFATSPETVIIRQMNPQITEMLAEMAQMKQEKERTLERKARENELEEGRLASELWNQVIEMGRELEVENPSRKEEEEKKKPKEEERKRSEKRVKQSKSRDRHHGEMKKPQLPAESHPKRKGVPPEKRGGQRRRRDAEERSRAEAEEIGRTETEEAKKLEERRKGEAKKREEQKTREEDKKKNEIEGKRGDPNALQQDRRLPGRERRDDDDGEAGTVEQSGNFGTNTHGGPAHQNDIGGYEPRGKNGAPDHRVRVCESVAGSEVHQPEPTDL
uniref:Trichohyalin-like n=1 Tax=Globodera pallida TaxID=36090 RepID=A0A183BN48_GLOPA